MKPQLFTNVRIFDGEGTAPFPGEVLIEGNRIKTVAKGGGLARDGAEVVDGGGNTLMPGMTEAHSHITFTNIGKLKELGEIPQEEHLLLGLEFAKLLLDSGFTSLYSAASAKLRTEVVIRNAINAGRFPGPRLRAASPEITSTGGLGDERQDHMYHTGIELIADGADAVRTTVRHCIREGVDTIKINISGDNFVKRKFGRECSYTDAEVQAAAEEAHARGVYLACHARANGAVKLALKHHFRVIYHCDFIEGETYDLLEEQKNDVFLAPAIGIIYTTAYEAEPWGINKAVADHMEMYTMLENCSKTYGELRKRGMRILPGGDYGFAWNPLGTNARDLEHFVNIIGFTPAEALSAATKLGGQIMDIPDLGLIKDGYLADLLLVRGNPTENVKILQDRDNLIMIMKDGAYHKRPGAAAETTQKAKQVVSVWE
ncbi:MAG TPA: amidohydrolase family protein [Hypericibacter adhaerens]|jgi:imidazolonepropionase-like amidohydrolase|uniref:Amidohydrolase n=1 Tax=Hypericibacter adhaerens TaxID=2602016 RepID=A0A5J6N211_9PROT|nr:amidohydrolase family protein [Hypericibacter adhaerens]QEX23015.1 amidohydrolase [Hypericibacter adhaerens]HWA44253.1 amidohydrolase family protein [Hypericibacter adhaerens]